MSRRRKRQRLPRWVPVACIVLLAALLAAGLWQNHQRTLQLQLQLEQAAAQWSEKTVRWNGRVYAPKPQLHTVLVIGIDNAGDGAEPSYNNQYQADFLALVLLDAAQEKAFLVPLNRDTVCAVPALSADGRPMGSVTSQLALAHTYGSGKADSCRNVVTAVERLLYDITIDDYVRLRMEAVGPLNDAVGGVTLTLTEDYTDLDPAMAAGDTLTLTAAQALRFVQARRGLADPTNTARMARQQQYLLAWAEAALAAADRQEDGGQALLTTLAQQLFTSMSAERLSAAAAQLQQYGLPQVEPITGEAVPGEQYMEFYPDEAALQQLVIRLFYDPVEGGD